MNITSAKYVTTDDENSSITIVVDGKRISVPLEPANRHYQAVLEWAEEDGNEVQAAE